MTIETMEQFKNLLEHDQKEVLNLIKLKNEFKKQEKERKVKAYDELIEYLKEKISILDNFLEEEKDEDNIYNCLIRRTVFKEILSKIEKR